MNISQISDVFFDETYHSINEYEKTERNSNLSRIG